MTDLKKLIALFDSFGIHYEVQTTKGLPKNTLIYITEDFNSLYWLDTNSQPELPENPDDRKVVGYGGFYCWFSFKENEEFEQLGISE